jgi:hypothetical protein
MSDSEKNYVNAYIGGSIVSGLFGLIFLCIIVFRFRDVKLAVDVIDASADFLAKTKRLLLVPLLYFFITMFLVVVWFTATVSVFSMADVIPEKDPVFP